MSTISLFICIGLFVGALRLQPAHMLHIARFLVVWWGIGTLIVTFGGPFTITGNGYFASYAAFIASIAVMRSCLEERDFSYT
jgi:hypothetical protein